MASISQYDVVRIVKVLSERAKQMSPNDRRPPEPGDEATVLEVYFHPPGHELECSDENGITIWLGSFSPSDLELELVWKAPPAT